MTEFQEELLNLLLKYNEDITTCSCCGLSFAWEDLPRWETSLVSALKEMKEKETTKE